MYYFSRFNLTTCWTQRLLVGSVFMILVGLAHAASFENAMSAYERQNYNTALREFDALAKGNDPDAQYMLGRIYAFGYGTVQNFVEAHKWFNVAAAQGHRHAGAARDALAKQMTSQQIARAQRLALSWGRSDDSDGQQGKPAQEQITRKDIARIQKQLNQLGYDAGPADGWFGGATRNAIWRYQRDKNIAVTGAPSLALLEELTRDVEANKRKDRDDRGTKDFGNTLSKEDLIKIQSYLNQLGYDAGDPNGRLDKRFRKAISEFQRDNNLTPNGEVSYDLLSALEISSRRRASTSGQRSSKRNNDSDWPWQRTFFEDSFSDGDHSANPRWNVASGRFWVKNGSLYTTRNVGDTRSQLPYAEIYRSQTMDNAFAVELDLITLRGSAQLEFGLYQDRERETGYRLVFTPGNKRGLELIKRTRSGAEVIKSVERSINLADGKNHNIIWARDRNGVMIVKIDGKQVLRASDRSFRGEFGGFTLVNWGGDYALRRVAVFGLGKD